MERRSEEDYTRTDIEVAAEFPRYTRISRRRGVRSNIYYWERTERSVILIRSFVICSREGEREREREREREGGQWVNGFSL